MNKIFILICLSLAGCATAPVKQAVVKPPDFDNCQKVATFAKGVASMKINIGINKSEFASYVSEPTIATFPIKAVEEYVYSHDWSDPEAVATGLMDRCLVVGYTSMLNYFNNEEERFQLKLENAKLAADLAAQNQAKLVPQAKPKSARKHASVVKSSQKVDSVLFNTKPKKELYFGDVPSIDMTNP